MCSFTHIVLTFRKLFDKMTWIILSYCLSLEQPTTECRRKMKMWKTYEKPRDVANDRDMQWWYGVWQVEGWIMSGSQTSAYKLPHLLSPIATKFIPWGRFSLLFAKKKPITHKLYWRWKFGNDFPHNQQNRIGGIEKESMNCGEPMNNGIWDTHR